MFGFLQDTLDLFGFTRLQEMIAVLSLVFFLASFLGGMLAGLVLAFGGPRKPRKLFDTISFRAIFVAEIFLIIFIIYYHIALLGEITASHFVYWGATLISGPILGMIGYQVTSITFSKKIETNRRIYRQWELQQKEKAFARRQARDKKRGAHKA